MFEKIILTIIIFCLPFIFISGVCVQLGIDNFLIIISGFVSLIIFFIGWFILGLYEVITH